MTITTAILSGAGVTFAARIAYAYARARAADRRITQAIRKGKK